MQHPTTWITAAANVWNDAEVWSERSDVNVWSRLKVKPRVPSLEVGGLVELVVVWVPVMSADVWEATLAVEATVTVEEALIVEATVTVEATVVARVDALPSVTTTKKRCQKSGGKCYAVDIHHQIKQLLHVATTLDTLTRMEKLELLKSASIRAVTTVAVSGTELELINISSEFTTTDPSLEENMIKFLKTKF